MKLYSAVYRTAHGRRRVEIIKAEREEDVIPMIFDRNEGTIDEGFYGGLPEIEEIVLDDPSDPDRTFWCLYHEAND